MTRRRSSRLSHSLADVTPEERRQLLVELRDWLTGPDAVLTPAELLRHARLVPTWTVQRAHQQFWELSCPSVPSQVMTRESLIHFLRATWVREATAIIDAGDP